MNQSRREPAELVADDRTAEDLGLGAIPSDPVLAGSAARELLRGQAERRRLAEELHGGLGQSLALLGLEVDALRDRHALPELDGVARSLRRISRDLERFALKLFPTVLHDLDLATAARWLIEDFERRTGLDVRVEVGRGIDESDTPSRTLLLETLRVLLDDVTRPAIGRPIRVHIASVDRHLVLEIADGDPSPEPPPDGHGPGLRRLRERLRPFGGRIEVHGEPGRETRISATIPRDFEALERQGSVQ